MSGNPYQPPTPASSLPQAAERQEAIRPFRASVALLAVPAIYNLICFNFPLSMNRVQVQLSDRDRLLNLLGFILVMAFVWLFGFLMLEKLTNVLHRLFARYSSSASWRQNLYATLKRAPLFAMLGALLWITWIIAYYKIGLNFFLVSVPIGIAAHILAALLYIPLLWHWFLLERGAKRAALGGFPHAAKRSPRDFGDE